MWQFWLMFLLAACGVAMPSRLPRSQAVVVWVCVGAFFAVLIGFRHEVGGDWFTYLPAFQDVGNLNFGEVVSKPDPGYYGLNWLVGRLDGDIYSVNLVCAAILMWGTVVFCRRQPNPWLALLVSVPYMLIVVGMGYTRQSVALGFALLGLVALGDGRVRRFVLLVAIGALFHRSAVLLLPIAALAASKNRILTVLLVLVSTLLMYYLLLAESVDSLWHHYVDAQMESQGGAIRVVMNALPAFILIIFRNRLVPDPVERRLWLWLAAFAMACIPLITLASTAVDRVALYLIPLQLFVFARLPRMARTPGARTPIVLSVVGFYATVQYVWLNYSANAKEWVPYLFMPT